VKTEKYLANLARKRERYRSDPEFRERKKARSQRDYYLRTYNLTLEEKDEMLVAQDGKCALCETDDPGKSGWQVDHCHTSGKRRALLCTPCNVFLGRVEKNPRLLSAMLDYIEDHNG
jgi:hypothetical protein